MANKFQVESMYSPSAASSDGTVASRRSTPRRSRKRSDDIDIQDIVMSQSRPSVFQCRKIVPKMVRECFSAHSASKMWSTAPEGWPDEVPFCDPNNKGLGLQKCEGVKPNHETLLLMYNYLRPIYKHKVIGENCVQQSVDAAGQKAFIESLLKNGTRYTVDADGIRLKIPVESPWFHVLLETMQLVNSVQPMDSSTNQQAIAPSSLVHNNAAATLHGLQQEKAELLFPDEIPKVTVPTSFPGAPLPDENSDCCVKLVEIEDVKWKNTVDNNSFPSLDTGSLELQLDMLPFEPTSNTTDAVNEIGTSGRNLLGDYKGVLEPASNQLQEATVDVVDEIYPLNDLSLEFIKYVSSDDFDPEAFNDMLSDDIDGEPTYIDSEQHSADIGDPQLAKPVDCGQQTGQTLGVPEPGSIEKNPEFFRDNGRSLGDPRPPEIEQEFFQVEMNENRELSSSADAQQLPSGSEAYYADPSISDCSMADMLANWSNFELMKMGIDVVNSGNGISGGVQQLLAPAKDDQGRQYRHLQDSLLYLPKPVLDLMENDDEYDDQDEQMQCG